MGKYANNSYNAGEQARLQRYRINWKIIFITGST